MTDTPALSTKQAHAINNILTGPHFNIFDGAVRSGKTFSSLLAWLAWIPHAPQGPLAMIGKTRDTIQRNLLDIIDLIDPNIITNTTRHSTTATILGRPVNLIGANNADAESRVRGLTLAGAYVDEATLLPEAFFTQLLARLSVPGARLIATTNPDSPNHWLKTRYLDRHNDLNWGYLQFTMDDNPALTTEYKEAKKREFTGLWYRRFIQGEWVSADGAIYHDWDTTTMVTPWETLPTPQAILAAGIDYGTTNPTAAILLALGTDNTLYAIDEWRINPTPTTRPTDAQLSKQIRNWLTNTPHHPNPQWAHTQPRYILLDPAAASLKEQLYTDGLHTYKARNEVLPGIRTVATLLTNHKLKISTHCPQLINEIPGYTWDTKAQTNGQDKPNKQNDHSCDALRYAVHSTRKLWRHAINNKDTTP